MNQPTLGGINLKRLEVERPLPAPEIMRYTSPTEVRLRFDFEIDPQAFGPRPGTMPEPGARHSYVFSSTTTVVVEQPPDEGDESEVVARFVVTYEVTYSLEPDEIACTVEEIGGFAEAHLQMHVWPFVRETVASASGRMGLSTIFLPLLTVVLPKSARKAPPKKPTKSSPAPRKRPVKRVPAG